MRAKPRIGLLGGSFNPAHAGHLHIALEALKRLKLDEVWLVVSPQNPLKSTQDMAEYGTRVQSAQQLAHHPRLRVVEIEQQHGLRYTVDTVEWLKHHYPRTQFVWLMGADNLAGFHRWRAWQRIARQVPIAVMDRAPYTLRALNKPFARRYQHARLHARDAALLSQAESPAWVYLTIPRHPLSSTWLRKTLGSRAFLVHT